MITGLPNLRLLPDAPFRDGRPALLGPPATTSSRSVGPGGIHRLSYQFLAFLKQVAAAWPRRQLQVICDNYATHKRPRVRAWLAKHPRIQLLLTPTSASWLNLVEVFFSIVERQALRRGDFARVTDLIAAIGRFCGAWNQRCQPFAWTKPANEILAKLNRQSTSATEH